jgi:hypothetical protein
MKVLQLAIAWNDAVRAHDEKRLREITTSDILFSGPKGRSQGWEAQRVWMDDASARFVTMEAYSKGGIAVLLQEGIWNENPVPPKAMVRRLLATVYEARDGRLSRIDRYWSLDDALSAAGLSRSDRVDV